MLGRFARAGLSLLGPVDGMALLSAVVRVAVPSSASMIAARLDVSRLLSGAESILQPAGSFKQPIAWRRVAINSHASEVPQQAVIPEQSPRSTAESSRIVQEVVRGMLGPEVEPDQPLMEAGLDSLGKRDHSFCESLLSV